MTIRQILDDSRHGPNVLRSDLDDGRSLWALPMTYGKWRLVIGATDADWYEDGWCYESIPFKALESWNGEGDPPGNWHRHLGSGRRRRFNKAGELVEEWVAR